MPDPYCNCRLLYSFGWDNSYYTVVAVRSACSYRRSRTATGYRIPSRTDIVNIALEKLYKLSAYVQNHGVCFVDMTRMFLRTERSDAHYWTDDVAATDI